MVTLEDLEASSIIMDNDDIPGEEFGQDRPPLSEIIKSILERYPDGQIFKEMIQNADDAGAKQVQFFIDHRQHGTCSLPNKKLGNYQGPALISANDAQFSKEDWVGIQKLQRSIKAKDPFKVGKFGIGFNSVYHITDVPTIVSGERVAYLEPQEQIWHGRPGRSYTLDYLQSNGVDALRPFDGIFSFNISSSSYPHTLFRFPLRTVASSLSQNIYTTEKIEELIDALKQEAKLLLLFLRSVNSIEVYDISENGEHSLLFKACIADSFKAEVERKRSDFNRKLRNAYQRHSYQVSSIISYTNRFQVEVTDCVSSHSSKHDWLVVNQVGSHVHKVLEASSQQSTFPLVGVALELNQNLEGGRIFCFLPMPVETASGLPVHINGTFGLTDDRRSLKWPGVERKNDPTANWNQLLVKELLPSCYFTLAIQAKDLLQPEQFYNVWPVPSSIKYSQWGVILQPFFERLFLESVVFSSLSYKWVTVAQQSTVFVPCNENLPTIVYKVLSSCGLNVVVVPSRVWEALRHVGNVVTEVTHGLVRGMLRSKPQSYTYLSHSEKQNLLMYCLADKQYSDLQGIQLIPLANGQFTSFQCIHQYYGVSHVYLCSSEFPKYLLPNLDHKLVDILDNPQLLSGLCKVANSKVTNLFQLTEENVASLLTEAMPHEWNQCNEVSLPHVGFPIAWFKQFWQWVQNKNLNSFKGMLVVPISSPGTQPITDSFHVVRLSATQSILYIPSHMECSIPLQNALTKLQVKYCMQQHYPYFSHKQLLKYLAKYDPQNLLNAVYQASHYNGVNFKEEEAEQLRTFLCSSSISSYSLTYQHRYVLENMAIFKTAANSNERLCSITQANSNSSTRKALLLQANFNLSFANLPSNLLLFTRHSHHQTTLLQQYLNVTIISDVDLLVSYIFPLISKSSYPNWLINPLMKEVLDLFNIFQLKNSSFATKVKSLPFLDTDSSNQQKKCPSDLFDRSVPIIARLYMGKNVFPREQFNTTKCLQILRQCGLHVTVTPQEVLNIVSEMCATQSSFPGKNYLSRCNAVLSYIGSREFQYPYSTYCNFKGVGKQHFLTFNSAINYLAKAASWLPVMTDPPTGYPHCLPWRGKGYNVTSLNNDVVVVGPNDIDDVYCLVGSQMFIVSVDSQAVANLFEKPKLTQHALAHFEEIIKYKDELSRDVLNQLVINMYEKFNTYDTSDMNRLHLIHEWIYLQKYNRFVSPTVVALNQNPTFRHNLEPYVYVLPESLSRYSALFKRFGVETHMTQSQILSVLESIKNHSTSLFSENDSSNAWHIVMSVLNWITKNGTEQATLSSNETLYVPIESESTWPELKDSSNVVYTDNDFLKDFLLTCGSDETFTFVDSRISQRMAECLGLTPLSEHLDISEDTFEDSGQHEPLTVRLKNILRDYKDGLTIVKELLQNADDAEATEVNICYDARTHTVSHKSLFFPGMLESHGPALIVHNNKSFTEEDFKNITKLAGATKQNKHLKIGKFGVGFCSVYHITDVPSFVSEDKLCIFDPTLSALRKEVKNPSQPGKKVKFTSKFIARSSQLLPYEGLFGFQPGKPYKGTLFRFPFRSCASELSGTCYTRATVDELLSDIKKSGSKLLLFLQHVKKVTFQVIDKGDQTPKLLLTITKVNKNQQTHATKPTNTKIVQCYIEAHPSKQVRVEENWVVSSDSSVILRKNATASVACQVNHAPSLSNYSSIVELDGELFCYLPLSQKTGLPVHVSSNFAVINNRRGIWTADDATSKTDTEVQWNVALMQNVIPRAYLNLLCVLQDMNQHSMLHTYSFYCLWPLAAKLLQRNPWHLMVNELYKMISTTSETLFYSNYTKMWLTLSGSKFLEYGILSHTTSNSETPECVVNIVSHLKLPIVDLSEAHKVHLQLRHHTITEAQFAKLFFKNLTILHEVCESRNLVIIQMLEVYAAEYDDETERCYDLENYFKSYACVPCTPDGTTLKYCKEVISPSSPFARLFEEHESYFPTQELIERHLVYSALENLGMIINVLPWKYLIERAQTISTLYDQDQLKALKQAELLIYTLSYHKPKQDPPASGTTISSINFLPVLTKPQDYKLPWSGHGCSLSSGQQLLVSGTIGKHGPNNTIISGSQVKFVCEAPPKQGGCGPIRSETLKLLHIRTSPTCEEVLEHLKLLVNSYHTMEKTTELIEWCDKLCRQIYAFFDDSINLIRREDKDELSPPPCLKDLFTFACIWNGKRFLNINDIARNWKLNGPYLFSVPTSIAYRKKISAFLKIKDNFCIDDVQQALIRMQHDFGNNPLNEKCQNLVKELVPLLDEVKIDHPDFFKILLPDEGFILHWSTDLAYNDAPWASKDTSYTYVNKYISRALAEKLRVQPVRGKFLDKYVSSSPTYFRGAEFGQREELTRRISNIIRDYPFDITVLKELLQNADDAKATKMYVILDKRSHGTQSVFSEAWQKLQGPALLVWNDSTFSEKDLQGIQELGLGSKRSDAESIGQYGIGFNVVYHLTDCPSFVTGGETLCIMDPHCKFVPGADPLNPGRRFDKLSSGLWETFSDIKSAYLQSNLQNCPPELSNGSLFRFPLRYNADLVQSSKIVENSESNLLTEKRMHRLIRAWAPKMKDAMLFLNHVTELKFCVIENSEEMTIENHFHTIVERSDQEKRVELHKCISEFKSVTGNKSHIIMYPLSISDIKHSGTSKQKVVEEKWLIQQGVGDIDNNQQRWQFIKQVKPRHGIAAPLITSLHTSFPESILSSNSEQCARQVVAETHAPLVTVSLQQTRETTTSQLSAAVRGSSIPIVATEAQQVRSFPKSKDKRDSRTVATTEANQPSVLANPLRVFNGQVFCFLPLPLMSRLPVHINGNFILNSNRRNLWCSTNSDQPDDRSKWNDALFSALASSYAQFLLNCRCYYKDGNLLVSIENYYKLFPRTNSSDLNKPWLQLAENVYRKLYNSNSPCLAVLKQHVDGKSVIRWYPLFSYSSSEQVYIWKLRCHVSDYDSKVIRPILEKLGTNISAAPYRIKVHFDAITTKEDQKLFEITPSSVFDYYKRKFPQPYLCALEATPFETVLNFKAFTKYLIQHNIAKNTHEFPSDPYGIPLLLTNDGNLRCFNQCEKVLTSKYCQLFPNSSDKFLHEGLTDVQYSSEYFVQASTHTNQGWKLVFNILSKFLPPGLSNSVMINNCLRYLTKDTLISLWDCLVNDPTFFCYLEHILKHWALLLTKDCCLYSSQSSILPVIPPEPDNPNYSLVCSLFLEISMPFLDTDVVPSHRTKCPKLDEHPRVLENVLYLHQHKDISKLLTREKVKILINYLRKIDFRNEVSSRNQVKSLPLFENIEEQFLSIQGKVAYIWPDNLCKSGYQKWLEGSNTVFVIYHGDWATLGSAEQLGIQSISSEEVYMRFIFPRFHCMTQTERYDHLRHIRDYIFDTVIAHVEGRVNKALRRRAQIFFGEIRNLCCIGEDNDSEPLRPVSDFYNHKENIFMMFQEEFLFLPEYFTKNEFEYSQWLNESPTTDEYLNLCNKVANGQTAKLREASLALTNYLFSNKSQELGWHDDNTFLRSVSQISFVCSTPLPNLVWIKPVEYQTNNIKSNDEEISMVRFCDATVEDHSILLWTLKPVVQISYYFYFHDQSFLQALGVCVSPTVQDVIRNVENICKASSFANQALFSKYPETLKTPRHGTDLLKVMKTVFTFLENNFEKVTSNGFEQLSDLPCVPVHSTPNAIHDRQVVLIKPQYALKCNVQLYHPFLHSLPGGLYGATRLLSKLGVKNTIELSHLQSVLELMFKCTEQQEVEINTKNCIQLTLRDLYHILLAHQNMSRYQQKTEVPTVQHALHPLYLPSEEGKLVLSTQLVYRDKHSYGGSLELSFGELKLSLLCLPLLEYGFYESEFCKLLPKSIRPTGLSEICEQTVDSSCKMVSECIVADQLKQALSIPMLAKATMCVVRHFTQNKGDLEPLIAAFLSNISVVAVRNLQTEIRHKELQVVIGKGKVNYFLSETKQEGHILYVDSRMPLISKEFAIMELVEALISLIKQSFPEIDPQTVPRIRETLKFFLKSESSSDIMEVLGREKIAIDGFVMDAPVWKLGKKVPKCWHHRLDQDLDNIFTPMEYVGYNMNGEIILAQIVHAVLPHDVESFDDIPRLEMKYKIFINQIDEEGIDVSVIDLYKFLRGLTKPALLPQEHSTAVTIYEGATGASKEGIDSADLEACKKEINRVLREIWKLPHGEKMKALHRLYLKWHPDKNLENAQFTEEVFKYLMSQIERLDGTSSNEEDYSGSRRQWQQTFHQWDNTARQHKFFFQQENANYGCRNSEGQNRWESSSERHFPSSPFDNFKFQPQRDVQEGKRWVRQAEVDFRALCVLHDKLTNDSQLAGHVCFMAHQVAEKALKGGIYAKCGIDERGLIDHNLMRHAYALQSVQTQMLGLAMHVAPLENYYLEPRYPNKSPVGRIPAEMFDVSLATCAKEHAHQVLKIVQDIFSEL